MAKAILVYSVLIALLLGILVAISGCGDGPDQVISPSDEVRPDGRPVQLYGRYEGVVHRTGSFTTIIIRTYDHETKKTHRYYCKFHGQDNNTLINHQLLWDQVVEFKGLIISERDPDYTVVDYCKIVQSFDYSWK